MTTNRKFTIMKNNPKNCIQLDPSRKIKIKLDNEERVLYVNKYFEEVTGFKISEIILQKIEAILLDDMSAVAKLILNKLSNEDKNYIALIGKSKIYDCYWGLTRINQIVNNDNIITGVLLEIKMLPSIAIEQLTELFFILKEINNNAGPEATVKYFEGYLEDKNLTFEDYILNLLETDEKKLDKYFEIDADEQKHNTKKSGWLGLLS